MYLPFSACVKGASFFFATPVWQGKSVGMAMLSGPISRDIAILSLWYNITQYLFREVSTLPKIFIYGAISFPFCLVSPQHICVMSHFATHRAIIVRCSIYIALQPNESGTRLTNKVTQASWKSDRKVAKSDRTPFVKRCQVTDLDVTDLVFFGPRIPFCATGALWGRVTPFSWSLFWASKQCLGVDRALSRGPEFRAPKSQIIRDETGFCKRGRRNGVASDFFRFFRFLPYSLLSFRFLLFFLFIFRKRKPGRHPPFARPLLRNPEKTTICQCRICQPPLAAPCILNKSKNKYCNTIATSLARYEKYRCWVCKWPCEPSIVHRDAHGRGSTWAPCLQPRLFQCISGERCTDVWLLLCKIDSGDSYTSSI